MEYWIVYDIATGVELFSGSGAPGTGAIQNVQPGGALALVPQSVLTTVPRNLVALRTFVEANLDAEAEMVRGRFLTGGAGQAMTYWRKEQEARAYTVDDTAPTPFLSAEAVARGVTVEVVANEVIAQADAWVAIGATIEGARMAAKSNLAVADRIGSIVSAGKVDWNAVLAPLFAPASS